jgi:hypothetical protein
MCTIWRELFAGRRFLGDVGRFRTCFGRLLSVGLLHMSLCRGMGELRPASSGPVDAAERRSSIPSCDRGLRCRQEIDAGGARDMARQVRLAGRDEDGTPIVRGSDRPHAGSQRGGSHAGDSGTHAGSHTEGSWRLQLLRREGGPVLRSIPVIRLRELAPDRIILGIRQGGDIPLPSGPQ